MKRTKNPSNIIRLCEMAKAPSMSVKIKIIKENEWSTADNSLSTAEAISVSHEEFNFENHAAEARQQLFPTLRPRNLAKGESMAAGIGQIEEDRNFSTEHSSSQKSGASLNESVNVYMLANSRIFVRNDASEKCRNPFSQPKVEPPAVEEISPLDSFWLASTAASSYYDRDDEQESKEDRKTTIQESLNKLEAELFADEETYESSIHEQSSGSITKPDEHFNAPFIRWGEGAFHRGFRSVNVGHGNIRAKEFPKPGFPDSHILTETDSDGSESVLAFISGLEVELHIDSSGSVIGKNTNVRFVDFDDRIVNSKTGSTLDNLDLKRLFKS